MKFTSEPLRRNLMPLKVTTNAKSFTSKYDRPQRANNISLCHATLPDNNYLLPLVTGNYWQDGYCHLMKPLSPQQLTPVAMELAKKIAEPSAQDQEKLHHRNAHLDRHISSLDKLLHESVITAAVQHVLGESAVLIRSTLINKSAGSGWHVQWHQDKSPLSLLSHAGKSNISDTLIRRLGDAVIAVRIHLDKSNRSNGGLQIVAGSHRQGLFSQSDVLKQLTQSITFLDQQAGDVMLMHPFILHASDKNTSDDQRRIIHCEFIASSVLNDLQNGSIEKQIATSQGRNF